MCQHVHVTTPDSTSDWLLRRRMAAVANVSTIVLGIGFGTLAFSLDLLLLPVLPVFLLLTDVDATDKGESIAEEGTRTTADRRRLRGPVSGGSGKASEGPWDEERLPVLRQHAPSTRHRRYAPCPSPSRRSITRTPRRGVTGTAMSEPAGRRGARSCGNGGAPIPRASTAGPADSRVDAPP